MAFRTSTCFCHGQSLILDTSFVRIFVRCSPAFLSVRFRNLRSALSPIFLASNLTLISITSALSRNSRKSGMFQLLRPLGDFPPVLHRTANQPLPPIPSKIAPESYIWSPFSVFEITTTLTKKPPLFGTGAALSPHHLTLIARTSFYWSPLFYLFVLLRENR
jgi:hypothetical protein